MFRCATIRALLFLTLMVDNLVRGSSSSVSELGISLVFGISRLDVIYLSVCLLYRVP